MPIYVLYQGRLIDKRYRPAAAGAHAASELPAPAVQQQREQALEHLYRQRERDLHASGSYDPRDTPAAVRKARDARRQLTRRDPATLA